MSERPDDQTPENGSTPGAGPTSPDGTDAEAQLSEHVAEALAPGPAAPSEARVADLRATVSEDRGDGASAADQRRPARRTLLVAAGVALLGAGAAAGTVIDAVVRDDGDLLARGTPEFEATLTGDGAEVDVDGSVAPEGRILVLRSQTLPVLPTGEYYELWFVAADGSGDPISAGTFHPDAEGRTVVVLHAAVDPRLAGDMLITHELDDGDVGPSGDVVASGEARLL